MEQFSARDIVDKIHTWEIGSAQTLVSENVSCYFSKNGIRRCTIFFGFCAII